MERRVAECLLLAKVLVADGMITENERIFLNASMARLGLSDAEKQLVADLEGWDQAEAVLASLPEAEKRDIVDVLMSGASADGRLSPLEVAALKAITAALGLD